MNNLPDPPNWVYWLLAALTLFTVTVGVLAVIEDGNRGDLDEQCIRQGYVESMELWGLKWCVRMERGELVGVQVE